ncbi:MAG: hypothetical protein M0Z87_07235 [Actinomycetota bacterium]|nr:hypothetical protein [Actinomycetota bacterium]
MRPTAWLSVAAAVAVATGTGAWALGNAPPSQSVLVLRRDLPPGHVLTSSDLTVGSIRVPQSRSGPLLAPQLRGIVVGERLVEPGLAGAPLLSSEIRPQAQKFHTIPTPASENCTPAQGV